MDESKIKLETQTKATFTRLYNSRSHPMPFMLLAFMNGMGCERELYRRVKVALVCVSSLILDSSIADIEDALEGSDEEEVVEEMKNEDEEELDLKKDKYVRSASTSSSAFFVFLPLAGAFFFLGKLTYLSFFRSSRKSRTKAKA
jgi:hypothetical protein